MHLNAHGLVFLTALMSAAGIIAPAYAQVAAPKRTAQAAPASGARSQGAAAPAVRQQGAAPRSANDPPRTAARPPQTAPPAMQEPQANQGAPAQSLGPPAPWVLNEQEQQLLDKILERWEYQSEKVKTFKCDFTRWEYDPTYGDPERDYLKSTSYGYLKYKSPDNGEYRVTKLDEFIFQKRTYEIREENLDRWTCDGKSIYEFSAEKKQVIERKLAPEMQGKAISDGPLPFLFGAKVEQLKRRYWMRDVTPKDQVAKRVWLEARPKFQQDAANFESAMVILDHESFLPFALKITPPGGAAGRPGDEARQAANFAYQFTNIKTNDPFGVLDFLKPRTPFGWKHIVEEDPTTKPPAPTAEPAAAGQATRPAAATRRK